MHFKLKISTDWMLLSKLAIHYHIVCVCVAVYWALQLIPIISGDDDGLGNASSVDQYDYMGYGSEHDEWNEDFSV